MRNKSAEENINKYLYVFICNDMDVIENGQEKSAGESIFPSQLSFAILMKHSAGCPQHREDWVLHSLKEKVLYYWNV